MISYVEYKNRVILTYEYHNITNIYYILESFLHKLSFKHNINISKIYRY